MKGSHSILIAGVGGQGNIVCGKALARAAIRDGYKPVVGQVFGASRRGGTVQTHIRLSNSCLGPLIPRGDADIIIGLEPMETLRAATEYAGPSTIALMSTTSVQTADTLAERSSYPSIHKLRSSVSALTKKFCVVDPVETLKKLGTYRVLNSYMMGALCGIEYTELTQESVKAGLIDTVGSGISNLKAFKGGLKAGANALRKQV
ncbi:MAG: 2-oxoacid:acceptor oxidoreductase family protein [Candidatus Thorarchaeota archaeon]